MKHFLSLSDISPHDLNAVLGLSEHLRQKCLDGVRQRFINPLVLGMLFEKPSLRTRVSFESLMYQVGGGSIFLGSEVGWGHREPIEDFIPVLTSYLDLLVLRTQRHATLEQAAALARCPIINGLSDRSHPCQILADLLTMKLQYGSLAQLRVAWLGDCNNVAYSLVEASRMLDFQLTIACPRQYQFDPETWQQLLQLPGDDAAITSSAQMIDDPSAAVQGAHVIYTDVWISMGQETQQADKVQAFLPYQVNRALMQRADREAIFLHCLPARRGEEVTAEVIDGPQSRVVEQAENRLHAQKGLVVWLLGHRGGHLVHE